MSRPSWIAPLALLLLLGMAGPGAQQPPPAAGSPQEPAPEPAPAPADTGQLAVPDPVPIFRSGINFIRVDVIATDDDGNPVKDLTLDDFELFEDGELQEVESFQLVEINALPAPDAEPARPIFNEYDEEREAARTDVRVLVIFFDDYHVRPENGIRAGMMLTEFLENNLVPTDLVGIMYPLMPLGALRLTRNHEAVIEALRNPGGVKYDYRPRNGYEQTYAHYPTTIVERIRNDVSLSALKGLMIHLGGVREGRKHVMLVSEGYTNYVPPQLRGSNATRGASRIENAAVGNAFAGDTRMEEVHEFFENSALLLDLREAFTTANRFNTAIYAVDPRGLAVSEFDVSQPSVSMTTDRRSLQATQDSLYVLAANTDGRAIINRNDLIPGLEQMMSDASTYYLIGYNSSRSAVDGKYHTIDVKVKRDGVQVRNRKGFWAMTERDVERALTSTINEPPSAVDDALAVLVEPTRRGRLVRTWVGTSRADSGKTKVTFVWEPTVSRRDSDVPERVLVTAMGDTGGAYFRGRVPELESSRGRGTVATRAAAPATVSRVEFDASPGMMQMSLAIEGEAGRVLDRDLDEIVIPDFTGPDVVFSTPAFVRARTHLEWLELVDDWAVVPSTSRSFRRTERLLLRFEVYAPGDIAPDVKARLLNRAGGSVVPLDIQPADDGRSYQVDIYPANLPPADYVVELEATTSESEAIELVAFTLTT